jgi:hypothetical protein
VNYRQCLGLLWLAVLAGACSPNIPEPESAGGKLYIQRCNGCHRLFPPGSLKFAMWEMQVERMQGEMVRRGLPPLTAEEKQIVLDYLRRHSAVTSAAG